MTGRTLDTVTVTTQTFEDTVNDLLSSEPELTTGGMIKLEYVNAEGDRYTNLYWINRRLKTIQCFSCKNGVLYDNIHSTFVS